LLVIVMACATGIGIIVMELFDGERVWPVAVGFVLAFIALLGSIVSTFLSCCTIEDDLDFEDYMDEKEEQAHLMRRGYPDPYGYPAPPYAAAPAPAPYAQPQPYGYAPPGYQQPGYQQPYQGYAQYR
jgi:hypothetical protein